MQWDVCLLTPICNDISLSLMSSKINLKHKELEVSQFQLHLFSIGINPQERPLEKSKSGHKRIVEEELEGLHTWLIIRPLLSDISLRSGKAEERDS